MPGSVLIPSCGKDVTWMLIRSFSSFLPRTRALTVLRFDVVVSACVLSQRVP